MASSSLKRSGHNMNPDEIKTEAGKQLYDYIHFNFWQEITDSVTQWILEIEKELS